MSEGCLINPADMEGKHGKAVEIQTQRRAERLQARELESHTNVADDNSDSDSENDTESLLEALHLDRIDKLEIVGHRVHVGESDNQVESFPDHQNILGSQADENIPVLAAFSTENEESLHSWKQYLSVDGMSMRLHNAEELPPDSAGEEIFAADGFYSETICTEQGLLHGRPAPADPSIDFSVLSQMKEEVIHALALQIYHDVVVPQILPFILRLRHCASLPVIPGRQVPTPLVASRKERDREVLEDMAEENWPDSGGKRDEADEHEWQQYVLERKSRILQHASKPN